MPAHKRRNIPDDFEARFNAYLKHFGGTTLQRFALALGWDRPASLGSASNEFLRDLRLLDSLLTEIAPHRYQIGGELQVEYRLRPKRALLQPKGEPPVKVTVDPSLQTWSQREYEAQMAERRRVRRYTHWSGAAPSGEIVRLPQPQTQPQNVPQPQPAEPPPQPSAPTETLFEAQPGTSRLHRKILCLLQSEGQISADRLGLILGHQAVAAASRLPEVEMVGGEFCLRDQGQTRRAG